MCFYRGTVLISFHLWLRSTVFHLWKVDKHPYLTLPQFDKVLSILVEILCHVALLRLCRNTILILLFENFAVAFLRTSCPIPLILFFLMLRLPPRSTLFPYTTLFR